MIGIRRLTSTISARPWVVCIALACVLSLVLSVSLAGAVKGVVSFFGNTTASEGPGTGQFGKPLGVAVNQATGNLYVVDSSNNRVQEFTGAGVFTQMWGVGVAATGPDNTGTNQVTSTAITAAGGTFALTIGGFVFGESVFGGQLTTALPFNASAAAVQSALEAIVPEGGTVSVTGGPGNETGSTPYVVTLGGSLKGIETSVSILAHLSTNVGHTLNCTAGPAAATTKTVQWLRNGVPIVGATSASYVTVAGDAGKTIQCQAFAINANAGSTQVSVPAAIVAPSPASTPPVTPESISGPAKSANLVVGGAGGQTLTCATGEWLGAPSFTYQWYRNGVALSGNGANTNVYTVQAADVATAAAFQCAVTGTNAGGSVTLVSSNASTSPAPSPAAPAATSSVPSPVAAVTTVTTPGTSPGEVCVPASGDTCRKGTASAVAGGMSAPQGIAVEQTNGNVYVTDQTNLRVDVFSANGAFEGAFGWGVSTGAASFQFCTTTCRVGLSGANAGEFGSTIGYPAIDPVSGNVYVADPANRRVDQFSVTLTTGVVTGAAFVRGYGWGASTGAAEFQVCTTTCHAANTTAGTALGQFASASPKRLAVDKQGFVYAIDNGNNRVQKFDSLGNPAAIFATLQLSGAPAPTDIAVNPVNNHVLVVKPCSATLCPTALVPTEVHVLEFDTGGTLLETHGVNAGIPSATLNGLAIAPTSGNIYLSWNTNSAAQRIYVLNTIVLPTLKVEPTTAITAAAATLNATVNPNETAPNGIETEYQFEYSSDGVNWTKAPTTLGKIVAGTSPAPISQTISGLESHTLYKVRLHAEKQFAAGNVTSPIAEFTTANGAPAVSGARVSNVESRAAVLAAQINPGGLDTTYRFEYGTTPSYGSSLPMPDADSGSGVVGVGVAVHPEGLLPGTLYYYRVVANNTLGSGEATGTFTTAAATVPTVVTGAAGGVSENAATLSGVVSTNGQATTYGFEIGTTAGDYGPPTGMGAVGAGLDEAPVSLNLTGLVPGTTYHYRVEVSSLNGTHYGADQTFTTSVFGNAFATPPATLPFIEVPAIVFPTTATGAVTKSTTKALTNAQKLAKALKACRQQPKGRRLGCEKRARKRYAPVKQQKKK